jgi:hypothetical protein
MGGDVASLAAEMTPYVSAAVGAYGGAVLAKVRDEAADATVGLGRRLLQPVLCLPLAIYLGGRPSGGRMGAIAATRCLRAPDHIAGTASIAAATA